MSADAQRRQDLFRALEEQRARISRDLHDITAQQIALIKIQLSLIRKRSRSSLDQEQIDRVLSDVDRLAVCIHGAVSALRPVNLKLHGLAIAIQELAASWRNQLDATIAVDLFEETSTIDSETAAVLYHIVQESLTNIAKHAPTALQISIMLQLTQDRIVLSIEDDGPGFVNQEPDNQLSHWGIVGLQERLSILGGILEISSKKYSGTTVTAYIPWKDERHEN